MVKSYQEFATENLGIFRIGSVDCEDQPKICEKEKIQNFPTVRLYPQFPAPIQDFSVD
jgi:thioredoxin-like negative regulator of GroEL